MENIETSNVVLVQYVLRLFTKSLSNIKFKKLHTIDFFQAVYLMSDLILIIIVQYTMNITL